MKCVKCQEAEATGLGAYCDKCRKEQQRNWRNAGLQKSDPNRVYPARF